MNTKVNIQEKLNQFREHWTPYIIAELNGQYVKLAKVKGEMIWHKHDNEDEMFLILKGSLKLKFRDGEVTLNEGEMYVVPKGVEHLPVAEEEVHLMLFEPKETAHTGDVIHELTVQDQKWL